MKGKDGNSGQVGIPRKDKNLKRNPSVVETLQDYNDHLTAISKIDDKIAKFEDLKKMKTDLYFDL